MIVGQYTRSALIAAGCVVFGATVLLARAADAPSRCAALGRGAFTVVGSQTCVRVSGFVAATAGFGAGPAQAFDRSNPFGDAPAKGVGARLGAQLDVESDTELGPMSLSIGVGQNRGVQP